MNSLRAALCQHDSPLQACNQNKPLLASLHVSLQPFASLPLPACLFASVHAVAPIYTSPVHLECHLISSQHCCASSTVCSVFSWTHISFLFPSSCPACSWFRTCLSCHNDCMPPTVKTLAANAAVALSFLAVLSRVESPLPGAYDRLRTSATSRRPAALAARSAASSGLPASLQRGSGGVA